MRIRTERGALPPKPERNLNAINIPLFVANPQIKLNTVMAISMVCMDLTKCIALTKERHVSDLKNDHTAVHFAQRPQEKRSDSYERS